ncbi:MAG: ZIP family metal transporter [Pseudomonadota bacterium]
MSPLAWICVTSLGGGVLSLICAAIVSFTARDTWVPMLVSYAVGALLGAVFLEILPHAIELADNPRQIAMTILLGILLFFVLEKLVLWRHCHTEHCEAHDAHPPGKAGHDHGRTGMMIMVGDTIHNLVDGVIIAAAFLADIQLGLVTAVAIIAHEIPQEVGDFLILRHSGYSKTQAFTFNLVSTLATLVGGIVAYYSLSSVQHWIPSLLGIAAASMLYVAVADLIPGLHKRPELKATFQQVLLITLGVASIYVTHVLIGHE